MGNFFATTKSSRYMKDQDTQTLKLSPKMKCTSTQTGGSPVINEIDDHSK